MRVATLLSVVAIATLTTMGPALAYGPSASSPSLSQTSEGPKAAPSAVETGRVQLAFALVKKTAVAPGFLLVKNDPGAARPFPNCAASEKCENGTIEALLSRNGTGTVVLYCDQIGGCAIVGGR